MKSYKIQPIVAVAVILVAVFFIFASYLWPRDLGGGQSPGGLQVVAFHVYRLFHPPEPAISMRTSFYADPNTGKLHRRLTIRDSKSPFINVTPANLPTLPKKKRATVESFVKSQGFPTLDAFLSANVVLPRVDPFGRHVQYGGLSPFAPPPGGSPERQ